MKTKTIKRTERGWAGHFCCAHRCWFRRNTLIEYNNIAIVISTVGAMEKLNNKNGFDTIGYERYYETMAFHTDKSDMRYKDINVQKEVHFESNCALNEIGLDDKANEMHECVVAEITKKMQIGYKF